MRDVVFEWYVPYVPDGRKRLLRVIILSAAVISFLEAVLFLAGGMLLVTAVLTLAGFFLLRSWDYEYEYVYVNGDFTVSKIIRKAKRKDIYHIHRTGIEAFSEGRAAGGQRGKDLTSGRPDASVYTLKAGGDTVYIEAPDAFAEEIRKYL